MDDFLREREHLIYARKACKQPASAKIASSAALSAAAAYFARSMDSDRA
jgi:hypothetical protein